MVVEDAISAAFPPGDSKPAGQGQGPGGPPVIPVNWGNLLGSKSRVGPIELFDLWKQRG